MENDLFGEFMKNRQVEHTVGFFPADQQEQFSCEFVSPGNYYVSETSLNVAELTGLVWEYLMHHYPADSSSPIYKPQENPIKDLQTSPNLGRTSPSVS